jgi:hypothetical protein
MLWGNFCRGNEISFGSEENFNCLLESGEVGCSYAERETIETVQKSRG